MGLDTAIATWVVATAPTATPPVIAVDGTSVRGTFARTGGAGVHLLAALTHQQGTVLGQRLVIEATSEIAWFGRCWTQSISPGPIVTANALHTTRAHARYLTTRATDSVFTVKDNQHRLHTRLRALPWPHGHHQHQHQHRAWPARTPHNRGPARPTRSRLPQCSPGLADHPLPHQTAYPAPNPPRHPQD